jgi:hypothetical protein
MKLPCREAPAYPSPSNGIAEELSKIFGGIPDEFSPKEPITGGSRGSSKTFDKITQNGILFFWSDLYTNLAAVLGRAFI